MSKQGEGKRIIIDVSMIPGLHAAAQELLDAAQIALGHIEGGRIYEQQCCGGRDCGCRGSTYADEAAHYLRAAIAKATNADAPAPQPKCENCGKQAVTKYEGEDMCIPCASYCARRDFEEDDMPGGFA